MTLARIRSLVIPPAWSDVWICPDPDGHLQATGRDTRGRKQYRYHDDWRKERDGATFDRLVAFGQALPRLRRRVRRDLRRRGLPREKVLAVVVELLDQTSLRVGNDEYSRTNGSYGLSTLLDHHVTCNSHSIRMRFRGKSGVQHERAVNDRGLARIVRRCRDLPGERLFQYLDDRGRQRAVGSGDVNAYIREATGGEFTTKVFRTWSGTVMAAARLAELERPKTKTATARSVAAVVKSVAGELGNTPAVCRASYIHPALLDAYLTGRFRLPDLGRSSPGLSRHEARVLAYLDRLGP
jgi:DNA topoisomerase-1